MRKINPNNFQVATRGTSREINRQIALNLVRTHQPISRADLAPKRLVAELGKRIKKVLAEHKEAGACKGVGVVVPGMVDRKTRRIIHAPTLGWRDVEIRESLAAATGLPVHIENSGKACALAQMWAAREDTAAVGDLVFVSVSDGIGVGVVVNGEVLRGHHNIAGEFGHVPLSIDRSEEHTSELQSR